MDGKGTAEKTSSFLQSQLLIAMPNLGDPQFEHTVTLICQHNDDGCFGLMINRPMQVTIDDLFEQLNIPVDNTKIKGMQALSGGPVQVEQGFIIHDSPSSGNTDEKKWENTMIINDDLAVTASKDILFSIAQGDGPENFLLALGCASWAPGQMEQEVLNNSWLNCPVDKQIIFDTPYEKRWHGAVDSLGVDVNFISNVAGHA